MAEVHITSYFSIETDLAGQMRSWPEFRSGAGYAVELVSQDGSDAVSVSLVEEGAGEPAYVRVCSAAPSELFERVLGCVSYALAAHSDNLILDRVD